MTQTSIGAPDQPAITTLAPGARGDAATGSRAVGWVLALGVALATMVVSTVGRSSDDESA